MDFIDVNHNPGMTGIGSRLTPRSEAGSSISQASILRSRLLYLDVGMHS